MQEAVQHMFKDTYQMLRGEQENRLLLVPMGHHTL